MFDISPSHLRCSCPGRYSETDKRSSTNPEREEKKPTHENNPLCLKIISVANKKRIWQWCKLAIRLESST